MLLQNFNVTTQEIVGNDNDTPETKKIIKSIDMTLTTIFWVENKIFYALNI